MKVDVTIFIEKLGTRVGHIIESTIQYMEDLIRKKGRKEK